MRARWREGGEGVLALRTHDGLTVILRAEQSYGPVSKQQSEAAAA